MDAVRTFVNILSTVFSTQETYFSVYAPVSAYLSLYLKLPPPPLLYGASFLGQMLYPLQCFS